MWRTEFFVILDKILLIYPLKTWKIKILKKWKKTPRDITLHKCTRNQDHMLYYSWEIGRMTDVIVIFHFGLFFPLLQPKKWKNKNKKNKKKPEDVIIFHNCTKNHDHMLYCSWDMVCDRCNYFSFLVIFCPFTPITARKMKI